MWRIFVLVLCYYNVSCSVINSPSNNGAELSIGASREKRQIAKGDQECVMPDGSAGLCVPMKECKNKPVGADMVVFMDYLCVLGAGNSVGVCCAAEPVEDAGLAGHLPAVAPFEEENEAMLKIERAENRGCGVSTRGHTRLVGARPTSAREWPWMASVTPEGFKQFCGGVLITDRHVLTAAHCVRRYKAEDLYVRLGEYDMDRNNDTRSYNFRVTEVRQHQDFDKTTYHNDIAILKLNRPAVFNTYVWPICLPPSGLDLVNQTAYIIGWGAQNFGGAPSSVLLEVPVPVWDHQKCVDSFVDSVFVESLCAGAYEGGRDACQGDSGGPLMYQLASGRWTVVGVVSWGIRCGEPAHPGIYTKVDQYMRWIVKNANFD